MTRRELRAVRDHVRRLFGLPPIGFIGLGDWRERRRRRIERDAAAFAKAEATEREQRAYERIFESESFKAELGARGGVIFPE